MNKLGIDKVKILLAFGFSLGEQIETALKDGKITLSDLPGFIGQFMGLQSVIESGKEAVAQALDLTAEERGELNQWAKAEFDVTSDEVEKKVEAALDLAISILMAYNAFKKSDPETGK